MQKIIVVGGGWIGFPIAVALASKPGNQVIVVGIFLHFEEDELQLGEKLPRLFLEGTEERAPDVVV